MSIQSPKPLKPNQLRRICDPDQLPFESTADLTPTTTIIGQPRATRAIEFGIGIGSPGYNIYVMGLAGTGRATTIRRFLEATSRHESTPWDWVYVHNFAIPHQPRAIEFTAGEGNLFVERMEELLRCLKEDLPAAFSTDEYKEAVNDVWDMIEIKQKLLLRGLETKAKQVGFGVIRSPSGLTVAPMVESEIMTAEQYAALTIDEQDTLDQMQAELDSALEETLAKTRDIRTEAREELRDLDREVASRVIAPHVGAMREVYAKHEEVLLYLGEVEADVLDNVNDFQPSPVEQPDQEEPNFGRYEVNTFIDHSNTEGAPVIIATNPTYNNLIGRIEYDMKDGMMTTKFTHIKPGFLHRANGGYLVIEAGELINQPDAWEALKRAIKSKEILLQPYNTLDGGRILARSLDPEAIPLDIKIILLGSAALYYALYEIDEVFTQLFKVKADFGTTMARVDDNEMAYAHFIARLCADEKLCHCDSSAVARIIEYGSEMAERQTKLSTRFSDIADIVRETGYWATMHGREIANVHDVEHAIKEWKYRSNKIETLIDEEIEEQHIIIMTDGDRVGEINALAVQTTGNYEFGIPMRLTAQTYMGSNGVVQIDREIEKTDAIHNKGMMSMVAWFGGMYAQDQALSFNASLSFEQIYGGIAGDSASVAELYTLLSSLSRTPIKQSIGITGSINQRGQVQAIGGVNEKIEGFFRVCKQNGLTGDQGVVIPVANVKELMLAREVIEAVEANQFHVWAISHIDEGIPILFGIPAGERNDEGDFMEGSLHAAVQDALIRLSEKEDGTDDEEETEQ